MNEVINFLKENIGNVGISAGAILIATTTILVLIAKDYPKRIETIIVGIIAGGAYGWFVGELADWQYAVGKTTPWHFYFYFYLFVGIILGLLVFHYGSKDEYDNDDHSSSPWEYDKL